MSVKTLDEYDYDSTVEYMKELGVHIAEQTNGEIRITSLISCSNDKGLACCSTLPRSKLFRMLLAAISNLLPENTGEILCQSSGADLFERLFDKIKSSE